LLIKKILTFSIILLFVGVVFQPVIATVESEKVDVEYFKVLVEICGTDNSEFFPVNLTLEDLNELKQLLNDNKAQLKESNSEEEFESIFKDMVIKLDKFGILGDFSVKEIQYIVLEENNCSNSISKHIGNNVQFNTNCMIRGETTNTVFFSNNARFKDWISYFYWIYFIISRILILAPITIPIGLLIINEIVEEQDLYDFLYPLFGDYLNKRVSIIGNLFPFEYRRSITLGNYELNKVRPSKGWVWTNGSNGIVEWEGDLYGDLGKYIWYREEAVRNFRGINIFTGKWVQKFYYTGEEMLANWVSGDAYYFGKADYVKIRTNP